MKIKNPYKDNDNVSFKEVTDLTQNIRFETIDAIIKDGLPQDKDDKEYLLKLLNSCDRTSLSVKKLEGELTLSDAQTKAFNTVSTVLNNVNKNPFLKNGPINEPTIPDYEVIEGEDLIGIDTDAMKLLENGD